MNHKPDEIVTIDEVTANLKAGSRTVYGVASSEKLPALKPGCSWRFRQGDLDNWIARRISVTAMDLELAE